jgi:hypothetical protein
MGAESAPTHQLGRIDPAMFAPKPDIVIEPRTIAAMQDAFQTGRAQANENFDRRQMQPVIQAQVQNATDPQLVEARKAVELAKADEAKAKAEVSKIAMAQAKIAAQMPSEIREMQAKLVDEGWGVSPKDSERWTPEESKEVLRRWAVSEGLKTHQARVAAELKLFKTGNITTERGTEAVPMNEQSGRIADPSRVEAAQRFLTSFARAKDYDAAGQPPAPSVFDTVAPGTAAPVSEVAPAGVASAAPGIQGTLVKPAGLEKVDPPTLGEQQAKLITQLPQAYSSLNQIASTYNTYKNSSKWPDALAPLKGVIDEINPWNVDAKTLTAAVDAAVPGFSRGIFGEVGVLTDKDVTRYRALLPTARTPDARAELLLKLLGEKLHDTTMAFVSVYEGNPAVGNLKKSLEISEEEVQEYRKKLASDVRSFREFSGESKAGLEQMGTRGSRPSAFNAPAKPVNIPGLGQVYVDMTGTPRVSSKQAGATTPYVPPARLGKEPVKVTPKGTLGGRPSPQPQKSDSRGRPSERTSPKTVNVEAK